MSKLIAQPDKSSKRSFASWMFNAACPAENDQRALDHMRRNRRQMGNDFTTKNRME
jgi:hypothetical protein